MQADMTRCLWRPMWIVLIICIWSCVLCNGTGTVIHKTHCLGLSVFVDQSLGFRCMSALINWKRMLLWRCNFLHFAPFFTSRRNNLHFTILRSVLARLNCTIPSVSNPIPYPAPHIYLITYPATAHILDPDYNHSANPDSTHISVPTTTMSWDLNNHTTAMTTTTSSTVG